MRTLQVIHRDLKPRNILVVSADDTAPLVKVADFGYARFVNEVELGETSCGTPLYMVRPAIHELGWGGSRHVSQPRWVASWEGDQAPEVFTSTQYDSKADLWSLGCIVFELVYGKPPYNAQTQVLLFNLILSSTGVDFPTAPVVSEACRVRACVRLGTPPDLCPSRSIAHYAQHAVRPAGFACSSRASFPSCCASRPWPASLSRS